MLHIDNRLFCSVAVRRHRYGLACSVSRQSEMVTVDCVSVVLVNSGDTWLRQCVARFYLLMSILV